VSEPETDLTPHEPVLDSVGVGPWEGPWPDDPRYDPELLARGDRRNVVDRYRYWTVEAIRADLDRTRTALHVAIENLQHDLNIGSIVRTANAFNVGGVHVVGRRRWNRRGAMVTDAYLPIHHHDDPRALAGWAAAHQLPIVGLDLVKGAQPLEGYDWPPACILLVGQEGPGLSQDALAVSQVVLAITQTGSTRSINVAAAAAIAMHAWQVRNRRSGAAPDGTLPG